MTARAQRFPYVPRDPSFPQASLAPMLSLVSTGSQNISASGLVDSGASINVLPYSLGVKLGFDWDRQTRAISLSGSLASVEARAVLLSAMIGNFAPVRLAFAWARTDNVAILLGQANFFLEFDVCFFRLRRLFELRPKR